MNRIDDTFKRLKRSNEKALIVFLTAGYPNLRVTGELIDVLVDAGVDALEIGVPFSDPIADGPVIQRSSQKALEQGITLQKILAFIKNKRKKIEIPILCMGYYNPFYQYGFEKFIRHSRGMIDGLIVPDLSWEESREARTAGMRNDMHLIQLVTPVTPDGRLSAIIKSSSGFLYAVSTTGVTGARKNISASTLGFLKKLRRLTRMPIAVGIGISSPHQITAVKGMVDGIIVGSAYIALIQKYSGKKLYKQITEYTQKLKDALIT